jgi:putative CocE/NonD family hydrolase
LACFLLPLSAAAEPLPVIVERNLPLKLRDGVTLRADLCRPRAEGKFPVLLARTPYDRRELEDLCLEGAARGYLVVAQDVRGRFGSEGDWYPFKFESEDGYDTVEWAAALPTSNGKVGMFGGSYRGAAQSLAAIARPPHLAGLFADRTASDYHDGWVYHGGAFGQWFNQSWTANLAENTLARRADAGGSALRWIGALPLQSYPVITAPSAVGVAPYDFDWLAHP